MVGGLGDCSAGASTVSFTRTPVLCFLDLVVDRDGRGSDAAGVTAQEATGGTARGVVGVTLGASGVGGGCSGISGAFFFFKALQEATPVGWEGLLEGLGEGAASNAACAGRDKKLTMEVCFMGLATDVLDFRNMLPKHPLV